MTFLPEGGQIGRGQCGISSACRRKLQRISEIAPGLPSVVGTAPEPGASPAGPAALWPFQPFCSRGNSAGAVAVSQSITGILLGLHWGAAAFQTPVESAAIPKGHRGPCRCHTWDAPARSSLIPATFLEIVVSQVAGGWKPAAEPALIIHSGRGEDAEFAPWWVTLRHRAGGLDADPVIPLVMSALVLLLVDLYVTTGHVMVNRTRYIIQNILYICDVFNIIYFTYTCEAKQIWAGEEQLCWSQWLYNVWNWW